MYYGYQTSDWGGPRGSGWPGPYRVDPWLGWGVVPRSLGAVLSGDRVTYQPGTYERMRPGSTGRGKAPLEVFE